MGHKLQRLQKTPPEYVRPYRIEPEQEEMVLKKTKTHNTHSTEKLGKENLMIKAGEMAPHLEAGSGMVVPRTSTLGEGQAGLRGLPVSPLAKIGSSRFRKTLSQKTKYRVT